MSRSVIALLLCSFLMTARAEFWMPSVFSDGMVLQHGKLVPVWGKADPGAEVTVEFAGQKKSAVASGSGKWLVHLDPMPASSEPRKMTVSSSIGNRDGVELGSANAGQRSGNQESAIGNVLVGEVWILAGQSNMGWLLKQSAGGAEAAAQANYPWLRCFMQDSRKGVCDAPAEDVTAGRWVACTPETAGGVSGVGFFFARALGPHLDGVPIALIITESGGTYTECWIDSKTLGKTPSARPYLEKAAKDMLAGASTNKSYYWGENNYRRPAGLFNGKVAPLQPFAVRGVLWYQGEGNSQNWLAAGHAETLTALITSWRSGFEQPDLPFLIVQLPRYGAGAGNDWPAVRAAQAQVAGQLSNVGMVVTIDCGEEKQIHPADKQPVGERLALLARAKAYGQDIPFSGPVFQSFTKAADIILVRFEFADGLFFKGGEAKGFEICGTDKKFVPAQAEILPGGVVKVSCPDVGYPVAVRYGWFNWGGVSLFNGAELPAAPFTTEK
jgi:sialate O-acetylesterase